MIKVEIDKNKTAYVNVCGDFHTIIGEITFMIHQIYDSIEDEEMKDIFKKEFKLYTGEDDSPVWKSNDELVEDAKEVKDLIKNTDKL